MAMKKTAKPIRPGQGQPGGPPNPSKMKISSGVTVLGGINWSRPSGEIRNSFTPAQLKEAKALADRLKAMESKVAKDKKANAKIIKKQNKKPLVTGRGATKTVTKETIGTKKKPVIKVTPRGRGMRGGGGMLGGGGGLRTYNR
jgi:hypothetical protein